MNSELFELRILRHFLRRNNSQRKKHKFRERPDHFSAWNESEFLKRFRLSKNSAQIVLAQIESKLTTRVQRKTNTSPSLQLLVSLRFFASGSFKITAADFGGIHQTTASRIIRRVSAAIASLYEVYVKHPSTEEEILFTQRQFYNIAKFPRCVGALDCSHISVQSPGGEFAELFRNRKGYFSLNVQAVSNADLFFTDVVTRWPGSTHDSTIFNNSRRKFIFESGSRGDQLILGDGGYAATTEDTVHLHTF